jgi:hypothetical protein
MNRVHRRSFIAQTGAALAGLGLGAGCSTPATSRTNTRNELTCDLAGHWPLRGDARDHSGHGNHGVVHGAGPAEGLFDGRGGHIEVPPGDSLNLGQGDFTLAAWVWTAPDTEDVIGDILTQFDPVRRRGFSFGLHASAGGYSSQGDSRHVFFGIDDGRVGAWEDCGRPSLTSNYISNSLTVFNGDLYAANTDAVREEDWSHVFRYRGGQTWEDCGRVGSLKARGAGPMIVHRGHLYAASWNYDWTRVGVVQPGRPPYEADFCRVYRYAGGQRWEDCGQPGQCRRLFGLASFRGRLYVTAEDGRCYVHDGDKTWTECGRFPNYGHPMGVHNGRLYAGVLNPAGVWEYDGTAWKPLGNPQGKEEVCNQVHALQTYRGRLHVTTWPLGHVVRLDPGDRWTGCGRLGDALEINGLVVYNGKLYGGSIPRSEVFRYDDGTAWTSVGRFLEPAGYEFKNPNEWARVTSLTVFGGKLFASMGSCTSSHLDAPADFRGRVYALQTGQCVTHDRDLGPGWKHLAAVRRDGRLELFVDGHKTAVSAVLTAGPLDVTSDQAWRLGAGETDSFFGRMRDVRVYRRALTPEVVARLAQNGSNNGSPGTTRSTSGL